MSSRVIFYVVYQLILSPCVNQPPFACPVCILCRMSFSFWASSNASFALATSSGTFTTKHNTVQKKKKNTHTSNEIKPGDLALQPCSTLCEPAPRQRHARHESVYLCVLCGWVYVSMYVYACACVCVRVCVCVCVCE